MTVPCKRTRNKSDKQTELIFNFLERERERDYFYYIYIHIHVLYTVVQIGSYGRGWLSTVRVYRNWGCHADGFRQVGFCILFFVLFFCHFVNWPIIQGFFLFKSFNLWRSLLIILFIIRSQHQLIFSVNDVILVRHFKFFLFFWWKFQL